MKDLVCGMTVTDKSFYRLEYQGQTVYFCGAKCKARFSAIGLGKPIPSAQGIQWRRPKRPLVWVVLLALLAAALVFVLWP